MENTNANVHYNNALSAVSQVQIEQPFTQEIGNRLSVLLNLLAEIQEALAATGDRLLGAIPRGVSGEPAAKPNGVAAEIIVQMEVALAGAHNVLAEARRLQSNL